MELLVHQIFTVLGLLFCLQLILKFVGFSKYIFPRLWGVPSPSFFQSMGKWAVVSETKRDNHKSIVTGSGDGIGKSYSIELANRGMNIVMISRTLEKLQRIAKEIEQATGRHVKLIQADFTQNKIYERIEESLNGLEIGILVNNVGMLHNPDPCCFLAGPNNDEMTRIILKQMEERKKGLVLNISSGFGTFPCPLYALYSASKAFLTTFSKALQAEYKSSGIIIQAITPYGVSTPMTKNTSTNMITKSSMDFVKESLNHVTQGSETYGCLAHATMGLIMNTIPLWVIHSTKVQEHFLRLFRKEQKKE